MTFALRKDTRLNRRENASVFITDAHYKNALAVTRSLGSKGYSIVAGSTQRLSQSFFSRYCGTSVIYPSPGNQEAFVRKIQEIIVATHCDAFLPIGYDCVVTVSRKLDEFRGLCPVPVAPWTAMEIACDKRKSMDLARLVGVGVPRSYSDPSEVESFPIVAKPPLGQGGVRYINSANELAGLKVNRLLLQEYVPGPGFGLYALMNHGEPRAICMHRRVREFPITGGPATAAESMYDPLLLDQGLKLLKALRWHGVAMAEFKKDSRDNTYRLMEINPKFWGSLDLSIACGVDFPYLATKMATDGDVDPVLEYQVGVRFHWPLPDEALHVFARPKSLVPVFHDALDPEVKSNVQRRDLWPSLVQGVTTAGKILSLLANGGIRHPDGRLSGIP